MIVTATDPDRLTLSRTIELEYVLDFKGNVYTCDDLKLGAGQDIPPVIWNHIRQNREWRSMDGEDRVSVHVRYRVDYTFDDQRPDPNGIVTMADEIADIGPTRLVTDWCDIYARGSDIGHLLLMDSLTEVEQHAEEDYR